MIQFNLLPDVKKEYIKAKRTRRLITSVSTIAAVSSLAVVAVLFSIVQIGQKRNIDDLTKDINSEVSSIQSIENLETILTVQSQLEALPELHKSKPHTSRLFDYLTAITPSPVLITSLKMDVDSTTISITGTADSLASVNQYADTIKFATYKTNDIDDGKPFSNVITRLSRDDESANYTIDFTYDPVLFDNSTEVSIVVPNTVTTRSSLGQPADQLFEGTSAPVPSTSPGEGATQ